MDDSKTVRAEFAECPKAKAVEMSGSPKKKVQRKCQLTFGCIAQRSAEDDRHDTGHDTTAMLGCNLGSPGSNDLARQSGEGKRSSTPMEEFRYGWIIEVSVPSSALWCIIHEPTYGVPILIDSDKLFSKTPGRLI